MLAAVKSPRLVKNWPWRFARPRALVRLPCGVGNVGHCEAGRRPGASTKRENLLGFVTGWTPEPSGDCRDCSAEYSQARTRFLVETLRRESAAKYLPLHVLREREAADVLGLSSSKGILWGAFYIRCEAPG